MKPKRREAESNLWNKFQDRKYRAAFADCQMRRGVAFEIRALRKKRGWNQKELAEAAGITQGVVSRAEDPNYGKLSVSTILKIAGAFDVPFMGHFGSFRELESWFNDLSEDMPKAKSFEEESR